MCSRQFWTYFFRFGILFRHLFFWFHESKNVPAIFVSGKWHQILILNAPTLFACTIANPLLTISTWYTQIYENLIDVSRNQHCCWSTNTDKNGLWWQRSRWFSLRLQSVIQDRVTPCYWFRLEVSGHILDTIKDDDGKTILGWRCSYCLFPGNRGGSRFFKHCNASKALLHLTKGKDVVTCTGLQNICPNVVYALTALKYSKANRKRDIAVQKNNLH